jgi:D-serine deaminase-like pyridoxal phosphate-dependent protein
MACSLEAAERIGGDVVSGGGTGTYDVNTWCTEIQAGSYTLMDTQYDELDLPFEQALWVVATVVSVSPKGWIVADAGLKSLGMDHGDPSWEGGDVFFCSDEHTTLAPAAESDRAWRVGDRVRLRSAHVDPTVAKHEQLWVADGDEIVDRWPVDLRHW